MVNKISKFIIIVFMFFVVFLILNSKAYAIEDKYTNLSTKFLNQKEIIYGIDLKNNKVSEVVNSTNFNLEYNVKVYRNNVELSKDSIICTGDVIKIYNNYNLIKEYYVVIYGDVTGSGEPSSKDALAIIKNKLNKIKFTDDVYLEAGRIFEDERKNGDIPNSADALAIIKNRLGKYTIIQSYDNQNNNENEENNNQKNDTTPVGIHGQLSVVGKNIVDKNSNKFQLKGVSTHGIAWFPQYVNKEAFQDMRDEWGINAVRLAMYSDPNAGYSISQHELVKKGVDYATELGLYVIIDWHILSDGNPNIYKQQALQFFTEMATKYKDNINVIYEICNEPNGDVQWDRDIKPYAEEVIARIRSIDNDAIIICGTPTWSQDVDVVANNPITGYKNIVYTLHFYAGTHKQYLRDKAQAAINAGLPLFVSEFGISDASGNGYLDETEGDVWIDFLNQNNISWMCWNLSNKNESSSLLSSNTNKTSGWTQDELSQEGRWFLRALKR